MDPPENSKTISNTTERVDERPPPLEPLPGPVDPNLLAEKLQELADDQTKDLEIISPISSGQFLTDEGVIHPWGTGNENVLEDKKSEEGPIEILVQQRKKHLSDDSDSVSEFDDFDEIIIYGNVRVHLPMQRTILQKETSDKRNLETEILKNFCVETVPDILLPKGIRMDVESYYWDKSFTCPKCPGEFNCTCEMDIKDVMLKLTNAFELVVVSENRCTICLQILEVLRKRRIIFCLVNIDNQEGHILDELRKLLENSRDSFLSNQIQHHWSHENQDKNDAEIILLGDKVQLPLPDYLDIIIIGTNSAALSICEEAEACGVSVGIIDVESSQASSLLGFHRTYTGYGQSLKKFLLEASLVKYTLKLAPFCGIQNAGKVSLDWMHLRINARKTMNTMAWRRRVNFMNKGVLYIAGTPKLVDRNTIQVACHQGVLKFHAKYIIYAPECNLVYDHFPGLHRYCYRMHKILSYTSIEFSKTLVYGSTVATLEYGGIFSYFGYDVTIMMNSKLHQKYDDDMINKLTDHMTKNGVTFISNCRIHTVTPVPRSSCGSSSIPNVLEKFMIIGQYVDTGKFRRDYFDNVIVIPNEEPHYNVNYGLEDIGVKFSKYNPKLIEVDKNFRTSVTNIYAVGSMVPGMQDPTKLFDNIGRHLVKNLSENINKCENIDTKFHGIYTPVEYAFYGLSESLARSSHQNVVVYHSLYEPWEFALVPVEQRMPCYMKLICNKEESAQKRKRESILGLHVVGYHAVKIVNSYSAALSEGLTKEKLDDLLCVDFTCASTAISMKTIKNADDPVLLPEGCCGF